LLARPGITAGVLANTLAAMRAQQKPLMDRFGKKANSTPAPEAGPVEEWTRDASGKLVKAPK